MSKKLFVWLPDTWTNLSDQNPGGPFTVCWEDRAATGALQVSVAEYADGRKPHPTPEGLQVLATSFGQRRDWGELRTASSGACVLGAYGTASFTHRGVPPDSQAAFSQVWFLSNGLDFVLVTFLAMSAPVSQELHDAERIAMGINLK